MASPPDQIADTPEDAPSRGWRFALSRALVLLVILILGSVVIGWVQREEIARDLIAEQLATYDLPATYTIEDIDTNRQILSDIVVGDPLAPDLTIDKVVVDLSYGFGVPEIGRVTLVKPRLFGAVGEDGSISFGALDQVLFAEDAPQGAGLPALDLVVDDGRARLDTVYGPVGIKLDGRGQLDDGFTGSLAAIAPKAKVAGCALQRVSAYGTVSTAADTIALEGPLRLRSAQCGSAAGVNVLAWQARVQVPQDFSAIDASGQLVSGALSAGSVTAASLEGPLRLAFRDGNVVSDMELRIAEPGSGQIAASFLDFDGALRTSDGFAKAQLTGQVDAGGVNIGCELAGSLGGLVQSTQGTLLAPLLAKLDRAIANDLGNGSFAASLVGRMDGDSTSLVLPEASLRGSRGVGQLSFSSIQYLQNGAQVPRLSGNFRLGGGDLPRMVGRMEGSGAGDSVFRLKMEPYAEQNSSLALPELLVNQRANGAFTFAGEALASGPLPGGMAQQLRLPLDGAYETGGALALWRGCTQLGFDRLAYANLSLDRRTLTLCPARGRPILRYAGGKLDIAAGMSALDLSGNLAGTDIAIASGPIGFAYPGVATASMMEVTLGPKEEANRFAISDLVARLGEDISGTFEDAEIGLFAVPLDLKQTRGEWSYRDSVLRIEDASFTLSDRQSEKRFEPLPAKGGELRLEDNVITASAMVAAPTDAREISRVALRHDLSSGAGFADLDVAALRFDDGLQPTDLTPLALGVVANVNGLVTGEGRIDWNAQAVTSSGAFSSDSLDLAAAFGPVQGARGTVEFSDLLSLTTAPEQRLFVKSINPGIEAKNGVIGFSLRDGQFLGVTGGTWPFMGGTLYLRPVALNLGVAERRRYVLEVEGVDAALFVENLELGNIAATGIFDGALPLVFDEEGFGQIEGGLLASREPGGNVSYVGELTYEDLSPIANYAFTTLRSLDYESMRIEMDGPLTGDIVTRVQFRGVQQGAGTKRNFITRQIADLPIQFNVNIRAPFYKLFSSLKSIYDPASVRDPREVGLLSDDGTRFVAPGDLPVPPVPPETPPVSADQPALRPDESTIQPSESEEMP